MINIPDVIINCLVTTFFFVIFSGKIYAYVFGLELEYDDEPRLKKVIVPKIQVKYEDKYRDQLLRFDKSDTKSLDNSFICEYTPIGNVIMKYNNDRELFEYYSDVNIPYRYLETVCRKYVVTFKCPHLYIDMESAIKESEQKQKERAIAEKESRKALEPEKRAEPKKNVFAKFKSYNKDACSGKINTGAPPKNSIPNTKIDRKESVVVKEMANRYLYQGKIGNFSILKKVVRTDKKHKMTFADFKRLSLMK